MKIYILCIKGVDPGNGIILEILDLFLCQNSMELGFSLSEKEVMNK